MGVEGRGAPKGTTPPRALNEDEVRPLVTEALADPKVRKLRRFLERRGLALRPHLALGGAAEGLEALALGFGGAGELAYITYVRGPNVREAFAYVLGEGGYAVHDEVVPVKLKPEHQGALRSWPFGRPRVAAGKLAAPLATHCDAVCGPCFLWLATCAGLTYLCVSGCFPCCVGAVAACTAAETYCLQCSACDWGS